MMRDSWSRHRAQRWGARQPWPAQHRPFVTNRRARIWFFRRVAFGVVAVLLITVSTMFAAAWLIAGRIGPAGGAAAVGVMLLLFCVAVVMVAAFGGMRRI